MKLFKRLGFVGLFVLSVFLLANCSSDDDNNSPENPSSDCYVQLFDGDNFTDDNIVVDGPGEFSDLSDLPGASKNWNDEADSFKVGENTTVTMWSETGFEGESVTYGGGTEETSGIEPSSMKIKCN